MGGGPGGAALQVAQVAEGAPGVAGGVLVPAGHGQALPAAVAAPRHGDHDVVAAVRQQLDLRGRGVGRRQDADRHLHPQAAGADVVQQSVVGVDGRGAGDTLL